MGDLSSHLGYQNSSHQKFFRPKNLNQKIFWSNILFNQDFSYKKISITKKLLSIGQPQFALIQNKILSKPNATQLKTTLKQLALELDTVVTCSTHQPYHHHKLSSHFKTS